MPHFDIDISTLEIGDTLTVADVTIGEEFKVLTESDMTVLTIAAPKLHEEEEAEEEEEEALAEPEVIQKGKKEEEEE